METIIRRYYNPKLVVMNIGDIFTIGPDEAAFAVSRLLIPTTVIPSHTNEQSTDGGAIVPGSRLDRFVRQLPNSETKVVVPFSGVTVEFDQNGAASAAADMRKAGARKNLIPTGHGVAETRRQT
jgi:L-ascorbate metabolism protein UlaG (beta-lactamase superfamily)